MSNKEKEVILAAFALMGYTIGYTILGKKVMRDKLANDCVETARMILDRFKML